MFTASNSNVINNGFTKAGVWGRGEVFVTAVQNNLVAKNIFQSWNQHHPCFEGVCIIRVNIIIADPSHHLVTLLRYSNA